VTDLRTKYAKDADHTITTTQKYDSSVLFWRVVWSARDRNLGILVDCTVGGLEHVHLRVRGDLHRKVCIGKQGTPNYGSGCTKAITRGDSVIGMLG